MGKTKKQKGGDWFSGITEKAKGLTSGWFGSPSTNYTSPQSSYTSSQSSYSSPQSSYTSPQSESEPESVNEAYPTNKYKGGQRRKRNKTKRCMSGGTRGLGVAYYATPITGGNRRRKTRKHRKNNSRSKKH